MAFKWHNLLKWKKLQTTDINSPDWPQYIEWIVWEIWKKKDQSIFLLSYPNLFS